MLKRVSFGFAILLVAGTVAAGAYKWVDENGVVHYSDRPHAGAEEISLPTTRQGSRTASTPSPSKRPGNSPNQAAADEPQSAPYDALVIVSPSAEETLWNIEGLLNVTLNLRPSLRQGHSVRVYIDGTPQSVVGSNFQLQDVYRGVHNLQAEVLDDTGQLMIRSPANRFYVQQNVISQ